MKWHQVLADPKAPIPPHVAQKFELGLQSVLGQVPLQYVIGTEWFHGNPFKVTPAVLIPRPETEELVDWILKDSSLPPHPTLLDIGTGSGCIAITISLYIRSSSVVALDKSPEALAVARENNAQLGGKVEFREMDVLSATSDTFSGLDIIVSNPPYVPEHEVDEMEAKVKDHEPKMALFVPDNDPLVFYRRILELGRNWLAPSGMVYFEIHRDQGEAVLALGQGLGYQEGMLRMDMAGNPRMVKFHWPGK
jgi:release factor glutamine methyltransferase